MTLERSANYSRNGAIDASTVLIGVLVVTVTGLLATRRVQSAPPSGLLRGLS